MTTYLICYDLTKPEQDYAALEKAIQAYGVFCHLQKSVWLISTEENATAIRDSLKQHIDENDKLFIVKTTAPASWRGDYDDRIIAWLNRFL